MNINGKQIAGEIIDSLRQQIPEGVSLAGIISDSEPEMKKFLELKKTIAQDMGIPFDIFYLPPQSDQQKIAETVREICQNPKYGGIVIELPLPSDINAQEILDLIPTEKDVDILSSKAQKLFYSNQSAVLPPTVEALKIVFEQNNINPKDKTVAVFGQGILVGQPVSHWLEQEGAKVFRIDESTPNPEEISRRADIVVTGVGKPHFIKSDMIKEGAIVIDFGYAKENNRVAGDVDPTVADKASLFSPVPGGMGPITIAAAIKNFIILNR